MHVTASKLASLIIAIFYIRSVAISAGTDITDIVKVCLLLLIPLALIWVSDELGGVSGIRGGRNFSESPGVLVAAMGWFFLVGMPLIFYLLWS